ncbi:MAG: enoyl-CoA hydratase/isomerase family protein, partial [Candidatus Thermoplasmatota archaeon]|nr:enoyl-CoA hydratase/isomerase family protein [Candidatus Thermoplasmatota archaeon]
MTYNNIILEKKNGIGIITINRPAVLNALDVTTIEELTSAVADLEQDHSIHVAVLTGKDKAFIAGADIKQMKTMNPLEAKEFATRGHRLLHSIEQSRLPYIAAVNGYALGGGCEVMMACDLIIASNTAKIGQPEINLGIHPGFGGTQRLPRLVGTQKAKELLLTGDTIDAAEALRIGLVNKVVEPDKLIQETEVIAQKILAKSTVQTSFIKELVNTGMNMDLASACALEISYFSASFSTEDQKEGMLAFLEKKKP